MKTEGSTWFGFLAGFLTLLGWAVLMTPIPYQKWLFALSVSPYDLAYFLGLLGLGILIETVCVVTVRAAKPIFAKGLALGSGLALLVYTCLLIYWNTLPYKL